MYEKNEKFLDLYKNLQSISSETEKANLPKSLLGQNGLVDVSITIDTSNIESLHSTSPKRSVARHFSIPYTDSFSTIYMLEKKIPFNFELPSSNLAHSNIQNEKILQNKKEMESTIKGILVNEPFISTLSLFGKNVRKFK